MRKIIVGLLLALGITAAAAQAPPPVPALPDAERRTSYSISASTCACAVGFQLYGDSTDVVNWLEVFVNGVLIPQSGGWTITSPTGPIATIPRPITNAVLTFTSAQTGTVQIVGARRPRRTTQFQESQPVPTRNFNQTFSDIIATQRELWDKTNDFTGRSVRTPPGETLNLLPVLASRANMGACFDSGGNLTSCVAPPSSSSFAAGSGIVFTGTNPTTISLGPCTVFTSGVAGCVPASGGSSTNFLGADGTFKPIPSGSVFGGYFDVVKTYGADPTGVANSQTAINNAIAAACAPSVRGIVWIQPGTYLINGGLNATNISTGCKIQGGGLTATLLKATTSTNAMLDMTGSSAVEVNGLQFDSNTATVTNYGILLSTSGTPSSPCNVNHLRAISVTGKWIKAGIYIYDCSDSSFENSQVSNFNTAASACVYISNTNDLSAISSFTSIFAGTGQSGDWRFASFEIHDLSTFSPATTSTVFPLFISGVSSPIKFIGGVVAGSVAAATGGMVTFGGVPTTSVSFIGTQMYGDNGIPSKFAFWTFLSFNGLVVQGSSIQYGTSLFSQPNGATWSSLNITGNTIAGGSFISPAAGGGATLTSSIIDAKGLAVNLGTGVVSHTVILNPGTITGTQTAIGSF